jgi:hypothetical protein
MALFRRNTETESPELLDSLADGASRAAAEMRRGPDGSPAREMDAAAMERQAAGLRRRAARARRRES